MARNIIILVFLALASVALAQPRGQWKYFEKSAAPEYVALTASDSLGRWVPVGELLSGANAVYGTGSAGALAEWATDSTLTFDATGASLLPVGTTAQRPTNNTGLIRYNSSTGWFEGANGSNWYPLGNSNGTTIGNLTNQFVPYYQSSSNSLINSPIKTDGTWTSLGGSINNDYRYNLNTTETDADGGWNASLNIERYVEPTSNQTSGRTDVGLSSYIQYSNNRVKRNSFATYAGIYNLGSGAIGRMTPSYVELSNSGSSNVQFADASYLDIDLTTGSITNTSGVYVDSRVDGSNVTNQFGVHVSLFLGTGTISNRYGIFIDEMSGSATTDDFAILSEATQPSFLQGILGLGGTNPVYTLDMGSATDGARLPVGTTAQRPTGAAGVIRYNSDSTAVEFHNGTTWATVGGGGADGNGIYDGSGTMTQTANISLDNSYTLKFYNPGSTSGADAAFDQSYLYVNPSEVRMGSYKGGLATSITSNDYRWIRVDTNAAYILIPEDTISSETQNRILVTNSGTGAGLKNGKLSIGPHPDSLAMKNATLEQYSGFNTYTSDPDTLTPAPGALIGFDNATFGWTQILAPDNLETGDEIIILIVNADTNTLTLDATGAAGFIRPRTNGDFVADATEAFTDAYSTLRLAWDGTNFWILEN